MSENLPLPVTAPFSKAQRATMINLVRRAVQAEILPRFRKLDTGQIDTKSGPADLVTAADIGAEAMIARGLQIAFPNAVVVGEEMAETHPDYREKLAEAELGFLIDPVDGTWNFANGLPVFGTMIAACRFGRPVFGMIYDPIGQDFIWADIDTQTTWQPHSGLPRPLHTRKDRNLADMMGFLELSFLPDTLKHATAGLAASLAQFGSMRCSAHQYRLLAQGSVDFFLATKLGPWDHAPGVIITQKAGGHAAMLDGTPFDTTRASGYLLCAGSEATWNTLADHFSILVDAMKSADADQGRS